MRKCPECKTNNPDSARTCHHCGRNLLENEKKTNRHVVAPGYDFSGTRSVRASIPNSKGRVRLEDFKKIKIAEESKKTEEKKACENPIDHENVPKSLFEDSYLVQEKEQKSHKVDVEISFAEKSNEKAEESQIGFGGIFRKIKSLF